MNIDIIVNDYLLAWYLLYGASLSKEMDTFKKNLFIKYKKEYNFCYKDKSEIIKYGKDFIPDNDILYNAVIDSNLFKCLKKETVRYKLHVEKLWNDNKTQVNSYVKNILRIHFPKVIELYIVHPHLEITEYFTDFDSLIWGSDKDKHYALTVMLLTVTNGLLNINEDYKEITNSILELSIINEIGKQISNTHTYDLGDPILKLIKRQIYPFWLMYLGYVDQEKIVSKMLEDKIGFDLDRYPIDKNMQKLNLQQFIDFCIKNNRHILKLSNIMKIEKDEEIEVI